MEIPCVPPRGPAMKILIVDDHPLILHALEQVLPQLDRSLEVFGATNRVETLTLLARHPDCALVLLDLTLPGSRGLDLLAELRRDRPLWRLRNRPHYAVERPARATHADRALHQILAPGRTTFKTGDIR